MKGYQVKAWAQLMLCVCVQHKFRLWGVEVCPNSFYQFKHQPVCTCHIAVPDWLNALIYIGAVASGIIVPLGISILIYDYCKERQKGAVYGF